MEFAGNENTLARNRRQTDDAAVALAEEIVAEVVAEEIVADVVALTEGSGSTEEETDPNPEGSSARFFA